MSCAVRYTAILDSNLSFPCSLGPLSVEHDGREFSVICPQGRSQIQRADLSGELSGIPTEKLLKLMEFGYFSVRLREEGVYALRFDGRLRGGIGGAAARKVAAGARDAASQASVGVRDAANTTAVAVKDAADRAAAGMKEAANTATGGVKEAADKTTAGMKEAANATAMSVKDAADAVTAGMKEAANTAAGGVKEAADKTTAGMKEAANAAAMSVKDAADAVTAGMKEAVEKGAAKATDVGSKIERAGRHIRTGSFALGGAMVLSSLVLRSRL